MAILLIDDESAIRRSLGAHLTDFDHKVPEADNGLTGLHTLQANRNRIEAFIQVEDTSTREHPGVGPGRQPRLFAQLPLRR
ncbi:MAG: response regulator [Thermodesulfobacteriota bacterium]